MAQQLQQRTMDDSPGNGEVNESGLHAGMEDVDIEVAEVLVEHEESFTEAMEDDEEDKAADGSMQRIEQEVAEVIVEQEECVTEAVEGEHEDIAPDGNVQRMEQGVTDEEVAEVVVEQEECFTEAVEGEHEDTAPDGNVQRMEQGVTDEETYQQPQQLSGEDQKLLEQLSGEVQEVIQQLSGEGNDVAVHVHPSENSSDENHQTICSGLSDDTTTVTIISKTNVFCGSKSAEVKRQKSENSRIDSSVHGEDNFDELHQCQFCLASFKLRSNMKMHEKEHAFIKHELDDNGKSSRGQSVQSIRELILAVQDVFRCQFCFAFFVAEDAYKQHLVSHHDEVPTETQPCPEGRTESGECDGMKKATYFKCCFCDEVFPSKCRLEAHEMKHDGAKENIDTSAWECQLCRSFFVKEDSFRKHLESHSDGMTFQLRSHQKGTGAQRETAGDTNFTCQFCQKSFGRRWDSCERHELTHFRRRLFKCYFCEKVFLTKKGCRLHELDHNAKCRYCEDTFTSLTDLKSHELIHSSMELSKCRYCDKLFRHKSNWKRHEMTHTNERPFLCSYCDKAFRLAHHRKKHERHHIKNGDTKLRENNGIPTVLPAGDMEGPKQETKEIKYFYCRFCFKSFGQKEESCKLHESLHLNDKSFKCRFCEKVFRTKHKFEAHEKKHTCNEDMEEDDANVIECQLCNSFFVTEESLKKHLECHSNEIMTGKKDQKGDEVMTPKKDKKRKKRKKDKTAQQNTDEATEEKYFSCQFCLKSFGPNRARCKSHELIHLRKKVFKCYLCEKVFDSLVKYRLHEMEHDGEKKCRSCEMPFTSIHNLKLHEMTHTKKKLYRCGYCDKLFQQSQNRRRHEMIHTGEKPYKCSYCDKAFRLVHHRKKHERRMHQQNA